MRNSQLTKLYQSTRGAGMVEYIILVGLVALFCVGAYTTFRDAVDNKVRDQAIDVGNIQ